MRDFAIVFVVLDPERMKKWCAENNEGEFSDSHLTSDKLRQDVYDSLIALANEQKLNSLEKPKQMHLMKTPFTDQDYLTPTMKLKRSVAKEAFKKEIEEMYSKSPMAPTKK